VGFLKFNNWTFLEPYHNTNKKSLLDNGYLHKTNYRLFLSVAAFLLFCLSIVSENFSANNQVYASNSVVSEGQQSTNIIKQYVIPSANSGPNAIISAPGNAFWFVEFTGGKIGEFFASNDTFKEFPIRENNSIPASLAIDHFGNIWFSDQKSPGSIWMYDPTTNHFTQYYTLTQKSAPLFILVDPQNDIWFTETTANRIGELVSPDYKMVEYTLPSANSGPVELAWSQNHSYIWITETIAGKIARFDVVSHSFTEFSPPPYLSISYPVGIVVDGSGNVWVSEHGGSAVVELNTTNFAFRSYPTSVPSGQFTIAAVATLAIDSQGRFWFVEHFANKVGRLDVATGQIDEFQIPGTALAYSVLNAVDSQGNFWFTEFGANAIDEFPANASSPIGATIQLPEGNNITSGKMVEANVVISNKLDVPQSVSLSTTSSFSATGFTSGNQISLNSTSINLPANGQVTVSAMITTNTSLPSGQYSFGIVAASLANSSTVGIGFISVVGQLNLGDLLASNYQLILVAIVVVLAISYFAISRRSTRSGPKKK